MISVSVASQPDHTFIFQGEIGMWYWMFLLPIAPSLVKSMVSHVALINLDFPSADWSLTSNIPSVAPTVHHFLQTVLQRALEGFFWHAWPHQLKGSFLIHMLTNKSNMSVDQPAFKCSFCLFHFISAHHNTPPVRRETNITTALHLLFTSLLFDNPAMCPWATKSPSEEATSVQMATATPDLLTPQRWRLARRLQGGPPRRLAQGGGD